MALLGSAFFTGIGKFVSSITTLPDQAGYQPSAD
jgi:hypothetical protein